MARLGVLVLLVIAVASASARADDEPPPLTHTSPLTPTGELVDGGHFQRTQSVAAFYHELTLGLTDQLELRLGMPGLPLPILGGDLQLRASVLPPASRLRLVVGTGLVAEWINGGDLWLGVSATVAYRGDRWGAHASVRAIHHRLETGDVIGAATAGVTLRASRRLTLFADVGELSWLPPGPCTGKHGEVACLDRSSVDGVLFGVWFTPRRQAVWFGLSALIGWQGDTVVPILPLLSFSWDYDLP